MLARSSLVLALALASPLLACASTSSGGSSPIVMDSGTPIEQDATLSDAVGPAEAGSPSTVGGGIVPTSCAEANGPAGCCGPGGVNYYCSTSDGGMVVKSETCASGTVCGWDPSKSYYACVMPPATSSSLAPAACGAGPVDSGPPAEAGPNEAGPTDSSTPPSDGSADTNAPDSMVSTTDGGAIPTTCAEADDVVGCCGPDGKNYYCAADAGTVTPTTCASGKVCGWNATKSYYGCVTGPATSDPSGTYPIACQ